ncbi:MAG: hypothetical protein SVR94_11930, partial [Pseudomonadota bacterium]|nr:hypothetical protein [Pseudomonadota bacterium]
MKQLFKLILLMQILLSQSIAETQNPRLAKQYISDILQQPEFETTRQVYRWRYIGDSEAQHTKESEFWPEIQPIIRFIAQMFELLLWLFLGLAIGMLMYYIWRWQPATTLEHLQPASPTPQRLSPHTNALAKDVAEHAWQLWQRGAQQAALSVLYRGALVKLSQYVSIAPGATEQECLQLVQLNCTGALVDYFVLLTRHWQNSAYGQRQPNNAEVQALCEQ